MTSPDPRLGEIEARLLDEAWTAMPALTDDSVIMHRVYDDEGHCIAECSSPQIAEFIANAPADFAHLLAELRKRGEQLDEYVARFGEHTNDNQGRNCPACNAKIRVKQRAAVAAATGGGE